MEFEASQLFCLETHNKYRDKNEMDVTLVHKTTMAMLGQKWQTDILPSTRANIIKKTFVLKNILLLVMIKTFKTYLASI